MIYRASIVLYNTMEARYILYTACILSLGPHIPIKQAYILTT
jgi:hypothetical protein